MILLSDIIRDDKQIKETDVKRIFSAYSHVNIDDGKRSKDDLLKDNMMANLREAAIIEAQSEAKLLLTEVHKRINEIKENGYNEGFKRGYEEGLHKAAIDTQGVVQRIKSVADKILIEKKEILIKAEPQIIELSISLAKKIVGSEIAAKPSIIVKTAKHAISKVFEADKVYLRVNPEDGQIAKEHLDEIISCGGIISRVELIMDSNIGRGGCIVDFDNGSIDARIETQLNELGNTLRESFE